MAAEQSALTARQVILDQVSCRAGWRAAEQRLQTGRGPRRPLE